MKNLKYILPISIGVLFFSCDHSVKTETVLNEDNSIDRTIVLEDEDSLAFKSNYFGIQDESGWSVAAKKIPKEDKKEKWTFVFKKHFNSIEDSNLELNNNNDTLFHIEAALEQRFRWFYTYTKYSDTYKRIDRFKNLNQSDFLTPEDYTFMKRLPPEGDSISKADQLFLEDLTTKINDVLVPRATFDEYYALVVDIAKEDQLKENWIDSMNHHKESIYSYIMKNKNENDNIVFEIFDSLKIPFPSEGIEAYHERTGPIEARQSFMSYANNGKYIHTIKMPGEIINTNADSLSGEYAVWKPSVYKFLANDFTMYAETRELNLWAVIVSVLVLLATVYVFAKKR